MLSGNSSCSKIRVLSSGILPQTLGLENFATASRWCGQQNSTTVEPVWNARLHVAMLIADGEAGIWRQGKNDQEKSHHSGNRPLLSLSFCHSDCLVSQLIDKADHKLFKLIQLGHHCLNPLLPSSRLPYSRCSLRSRGHQFSLRQLNTALYRNMFVDRCLFQYI